MKTPFQPFTPHPLFEGFVGLLRRQGALRADAQGKLTEGVFTAPALVEMANARGIDMLNVDYQCLDLVPKGRDEDGRGPFWVRRHDEYGR